MLDFDIDFAIALDWNLPITGPYEISIIRRSEIEKPPDLIEDVEGSAGIEDS
jgi:hypothetical protein